jgi:hypothetical protein
MLLSNALDDQNGVALRHRRATLTLLGACIQLPGRPATMCAHDRVARRRRVP